MTEMLSPINFRQSFGLLQLLYRSLCLALNHWAAIDIPPFFDCTPGLFKYYGRVNLEVRTLDRIAREFPIAEQAAVIALLNSYTGPESQRVVWDILELSKGNMGNARTYVQAAQADYRNVVYWAEHYEEDRLLKSCDSKQMIEEILAKLRKRA